MWTVWLALSVFEVKSLIPKCAFNVFVLAKTKKDQAIHSSISKGTRCSVKIVIDLKEVS